MCEPCQRQESQVRGKALLHREGDKNPHPHLSGASVLGLVIQTSRPPAFPGLIPVLALLLALRGQSDPHEEWNCSLSLLWKMQVKLQRET